MCYWRRRRSASAEESHLTAVDSSILTTPISSAAVRVVRQVCSGAGRAHSKLSFIRVMGIMSALRRFYHSDGDDGTAAWWLESPEHRAAAARLGRFVEVLESIYTDEQLDEFRQGLTEVEPTPGRAVPEDVAGDGYQVPLQHTTAQREAQRGCRTIRASTIQDRSAHLPGYRRGGRFSNRRTTGLQILPLLEVSSQRASDSFPSVPCWEAIQIHDATSHPGGP